MARHERKSRPWQGGSNPAGTQDQDDVYSGSDPRARLTLAYIEDAWKAKLQRGLIGPSRAIRWKSDGKVIRVNMKPTGYRIRQAEGLFEVCLYAPSCVPKWRWIVLGRALDRTTAIAILEMLRADDMRPIWPEVRT
jgi:hypothetical protein